MRYEITLLFYTVVLSRDMTYVKRERKILTDNKGSNLNDQKYDILPLDGKKLHDLYRHTTKLIK